MQSYPVLVSLIENGQIVESWNDVIYGISWDVAYRNTVDLYEDETTEVIVNFRSINAL